MSYIPYPKNTAISFDAGGRARSSEMTTLFDGKSTVVDNPYVYENVGTGVGTFNLNQYNMSVGGGQYMIRRSRRVMPYFSGKSQLIEMTLDHFAPEPNVVKKFGYFDTDPVAPYNSGHDGFWIESDGTTVRFKVAKNGLTIVNIPWTEWDNYEAIVGYDWNNFTVVAFDFLWLGGAVIRVFLKTTEGFIHVHSYVHASNSVGVMFNTPNHSLRYDIHSSVGTGYMNSICSQCASEGSSAEAGNSLALYSPTAIIANTVGVIYAIMGIKKTTLHRDKSIGITSIGASNTSAGDTGILMLIINPTMSAPLTYTDKSEISVGTSVVSITITPNTGRVIYLVPTGVVGAGYGLNDSYLSYLGNTIDNISDEYVLAYLSTTVNQSVYGTMIVKEY